jgi:hypothetical protein
MLNSWIRPPIASIRGVGMHMDAQHCVRPCSPPRTWQDFRLIS